MEASPGTPVGTPGSPTTATVSVQGVASMTPLKVDPSGVTSPVSGTVTANAGTNLNTSLLAVEAGGHLASVDTHTASIDTKTPVLGQALAADAVPVVLTAAQVTTLTPPAAIANFANETGGNLATIAGRTPANGQATMANSRPVAIASDQSTLNVNIISGGTGGGAMTVADGADVAQGTTTDASTANTVIGRLKKLISLLPTALGSATSANSLPVVIASDQGTVKVNVQGGIAGTAVLANVASSIAAGGVAIQAANAARKGLIVVNDSASATLYLAYAASISATSYTEIVYPGQTWEMPVPGYSGLIQGIWSAAVGTARVTELS